MEELTRYQQAEIEWMLHGDLSKLQDDEIAYLYKSMCAARGWDWMTRPFELMGVEDEDDEGNPITRKELYPTRQAAALLARDGRLNVEDKGEKWDDANGLYYSYARATDPSGRYWDDEGVVAIAREQNGQLQRMWPSKVANLVLVAKSKARRRAILGLSALAKPDAETEMSTVRGARVLPLPDMKDDPIKGGFRSEADAWNPEGQREWDDAQRPRPMGYAPATTTPAPTDDGWAGQAPPPARHPRHAAPAQHSDLELQELKASIGRITSALAKSQYKPQAPRAHDFDTLTQYRTELLTLATARGVEIDTDDGGDYMQF